MSYCYSFLLSHLALLGSHLSNLSHPNCTNLLISKQPLAPTTPKDLTNISPIQTIFSLLTHPQYSLLTATPTT